jgi:hypothetical protein
MIEFIVAVDPRPITKARHFVSVAQALGRGLVRPCCHARKRDRFSAHRKPQKVLDRLGLLRHLAPPFTHRFPRRAVFWCIPCLSGVARIVIHPVDETRIIQSKQNCINPVHHPQRWPIFKAGPPSVSYNVCMPIEEDESPAVAEQQTCECEDQFDEDLMRHLAKRHGPNPSGPPSRPQ